MSISSKKYWELVELENELFWVSHLDFFLQKKNKKYFPWKSVKVYQLTKKVKIFEQGKRDDTFWPMPNILTGSVLDINLWYYANVINSPRKVHNRLKSFPKIFMKRMNIEEISFETLSGSYCKVPSSNKSRLYMKAFSGCLWRWFLVFYFMYFDLLTKNLINFWHPKLTLKAQFW